MAAEGMAKTKALTRGASCVMLVSMGTPEPADFPQEIVVLRGADGALSICSVDDLRSTLTPYTIAAQYSLEGLFCVVPKGGKKEDA